MFFALVVGPLAACPRAECGGEVKCFGARVNSSVLGVPLRTSHSFASHRAIRLPAPPAVRRHGASYCIPADLRVYALGVHEAAVPIRICVQHAYNLVIPAGVGGWYRRMRFAVQPDAASDAVRPVQGGRSPDCDRWRLLPTAQCSWFR